MVNFRKLADQAKKAVDAAGGPEAVKEKAAGLKEVAQSKGSLSDKAKRAAEVVREQDEPESAAPVGPPESSPPGAAAPSPGRREQRHRDRRRHGGKRGGA